MSKKYTKEQIGEMLEASEGKMELVYQKGFVNYIATTLHTKEIYTEVVAEWLMRKIERLDQIPKITREASYRTKSHKAPIDIAHAQRVEDRIAKQMFNQKGLPLLGVVLDFQTPLKNKRSDPAGKIDLLAYDGFVLRILELKEPESRETMLRCVLEGYTYFKRVDVDKLLRDFGLAPDTKVRVSPLVFHNKFQHREMMQERPHLKALMKKLDIEPFYVHKAKDFYLVTTK